MCPDDQCANQSPNLIIKFFKSIGVLGLTALIALGGAGAVLATNKLNRHHNLHTKGLKLISTEAEEFVKRQLKTPNARYCDLIIYPDKEKEGGLVIAAWLPRKKGDKKPQKDSTKFKVNVSPEEREALGLPKNNEKYNIFYRFSKHPDNPDQLVYQPVTRKDDDGKFYVNGKKKPVELG